MNANSNCRTLWLVWKVLSFKKFLFVQWAWSHFLFGNIKLQFIFLQVFESKFIEVDIVTRYICTENFQLSVLIWYFKMTFKLDLWKFLYSGLVYVMINAKIEFVTLDVEARTPMSANNNLYHIQYNWIIFEKSIERNLYILLKKKII